MRMPTNSGGDFTPPPEGTHPARCYRVVDLGTQETNFQGQVKHQRKVIVSWELPTEPMEDGKPFTVHQRYTFSSHEKSNFRKHLESWRGKRFTDADFGDDGFDIANLLGVPCLLTVVHNTSGERTYANVDSVVKLPKDYEVPKAVNDTMLMSLEPGEFDATTFALLPEGLQETIRKSPEFAEITNGHAKEHVSEADDDLDDSIPF